MNPFFRSVDSMRNGADMVEVLFLDGCFMRCTNGSSC